MNLYKMHLLFHELGHAFHYLSSPSTEHGIPRDAVEYPSVLLELHSLQPQNVVNMISSSGRRHITQ